jgi:hypothetical protein
MTDDLVRRLRRWITSSKPTDYLLNEAADRIERLEAALREIDEADKFSVDYLSAVKRITRRALEGKT